MQSGSLTLHFSNLLKRSDVHLKELHRGFAKFQDVSLVQECRKALTSPAIMSTALLHLNTQLEQDGLELAEGLVKIMGNEAIVLKEELTVDGFLSKLDYRKPIFDEGVSPIHGKFTHAIQQYILEFYLGKEKVSEIFHLIRSGPVEQCDFDANRKWTLWDEFLDRPAPLTIANCKRQSVRDAITCGARTSIMVPPCLDGRSPEWLTTAIALASNHGIDRIHETVTTDLKNRADNVHEDIFVTGMENDQYLLLFSPRQTEEAPVIHSYI